MPGVAMLAKSKRRQARRAKKQGDVAQEAPEPVPLPSAEMPMAPSFDAPIAPSFDAPIGMPGNDLKDLRDSFVRDQTAISEVLPSFDDFRRRDQLDAQATAALGAPVEGGQRGRGVRGEPAELTPAEKVQERMFNLLTFDGIDDRPVNEDPYDMVAKVLGRGLPNKAGVYLLPYLQAGHMLLLGTLLLSSLISYPGFPLTEVPDEYRALLLEGLAITYVINAVAAVYSRGIAAAKEESINFWTIKVRRRLW